MDVLRFSKNWNNKLDNDCFTTLRPYDPTRYEEGEVIQIQLKENDSFINYCQAALVGIKVFVLQNLQPSDAYLDTGQDKEETIRIIEEAYKERLKNPRTDWFCLLILKRIPE